MKNLELIKQKTKTPQVNMTLDKFKKNKDAVDLTTYLNFMRRLAPTKQDIETIIAKCRVEIEREKQLAFAQYYKPPPENEEVEILLVAREMCQSVFLQKNSLWQHIEEALETAQTVQKQQNAQLEIQAKQKRTIVIGGAPQEAQPVADTNYLDEILHNKLQ